MSTTEAPDLQHRRALAEKFGFTTAEDVCALFNISACTERAKRKRGMPLADYVVVGNAVLYRTASLVEKLEASVRTGSRSDTRAVL